LLCFVLLPFICHAAVLTTCHCPAEHKSLVNLLKLDTVRFLAPEFNSFCIHASEDCALTVNKLLVCLVLGQPPLDSTAGMLLPSRKECPSVTMTAALCERMENVNNSVVKAMTILESEQQENERDHRTAPACTVNQGFPSTPAHKEDSGNEVFPSTPAHKEDSGDQWLSTPAATSHETLKSSRHMMPPGSLEPLLPNPRPLPAWCLKMLFKS